mmetsp:Transcript_14160/g.38926  ORF Transcript_14160/g.38926 Transcript_14160/m.38926 type:complete len:282 (-) Transcript_14160:1969-2814(-)
MAQDGPLRPFLERTLCIRHLRERASDGSDLIGERLHEHGQLLSFLAAAQSNLLAAAAAAARDLDLVELVQQITTQLVHLALDSFRDGASADSLRRRHGWQRGTSRGLHGRPSQARRPDNLFPGPVQRRAEHLTMRPIFGVTLQILPRLGSIQKRVEFEVQRVERLPRAVVKHVQSPRRVHGRIHAPDAGRHNPARVVFRGFNLAQHPTPVPAVHLLHLKRRPILHQLLAGAVVLHAKAVVTVNQAKLSEVIIRSLVHLVPDVGIQTVLLKSPVRLGVSDDL